VLVYWLLFGITAAMALAYPSNHLGGRQGPAYALVFGVFLLTYVLIAALRYEVGGDWVTYDLMYDEINRGSLGDAMTYTDPGFGALLFLSAKLEWGIYPVNGFCALVIGLGTINVARWTRDPWLGIIMALPYLLIVVGMGYLRQGAAIGFILLAISALQTRANLRVLIYLALATSFHSTAAIVFPLFGYVMASRNRFLALVLSALGAGAVFFVLSSQLQEFQVGYVDAQYESGGALPRALINAAPSILLLLFRRNFVFEPRSRIVWIVIAIANLAALIALALSPSSTAVDRIGLYFSIIQILVFGEVCALLAARGTSVLLIRIAVIGAAAVVQSVWLILATHARFWVPYQSVFDYM
jgi:EpsG family